MIGVNFVAWMSNIKQAHGKPTLHVSVNLFHVGNNDVNSKEPRLTAEGIVNLALQIEGDAPNTNIAISGLVSRQMAKKEKSQVSTKSSKNSASRTTGILLDTIMST